MSALVFRRAEHPVPGEATDRALSAYDVLLGDAVIGQVWQERRRAWSYSGWKRGGQPGRHATRWVHSLDRDNDAATRAEAADALLHAHRRAEGAQA